MAMQASLNRLGDPAPPAPIPAGGNNINQLYQQYQNFRQHGTPLYPTHGQAPQKPASYHAPAAQAYPNIPYQVQPAPSPSYPTTYPAHGVPQSSYPQPAAAPVAYRPTQPSYTQPAPSQARPAQSSYTQPPPAPAAQGSAAGRGPMSALAAAASSFGAAAVKAISSGSTCGGCGRGFGIGPQVKALDQTWHPGCLKCAGCEQSLISGSIASFQVGQDGKPYHAGCHTQKFVPLCVICGR
eukprot:gene14319-20303_t